MLRLVLTLILILPMSAAMADITGKPRVIDGDTIEIAGERIRLNGIDTPEANQTCLDGNGKRWRCGQEATYALLFLVGKHWITCKGNERDKYDRLIAVCFAGPFDLNAEMVRQGWALAYRKYSTAYEILPLCNHANAGSAIGDPQKDNGTLDTAATFSNRTRVYCSAEWRQLAAREYLPPGTLISRC